MLLWIVLASAVGRALSDCPNAEFIGPACSCKTVLFGTHVVCSNVNGSRALRDVFNVLVNYEVATLLFRGLRASDPLPADAFRGMRVKTLNLVDSVFSFSADGPPLAGLEESLLRLDLMNCDAGDLARLNFTHLRRLTEFNAQFVRLASLPGHWFGRGPADVRHLRLDHDEIESVEEGALAGLDRLRKLSLADNRLAAGVAGPQLQPAGVAARGLLLRHARPEAGGAVRQPLPLAARDYLADGVDPAGAPAAERQPGGVRPTHQVAAGAEGARPPGGHLSGARDAERVGAVGPDPRAAAGRGLKSHPTLFIGPPPIYL